MWRKSLIDYIRPRLAGKVEGDFLEVGVCRGELTLALSALAAALNRKVYSFDVCNVNFDSSVNNKGLSMPAYYAGLGLNSENQEKIIRDTVSSCSNVVFTRKDSAKIVFKPTQTFCFVVIDGCHTVKYVRGDFKLAWKHLSPGGYMAMHDYKGDMPHVTETIDKLLKEHKSEVNQAEAIAGWWMVIQKKVEVE